MQLIGFFLLVAGWIILLASIALLSDVPRTAFALAGWCVQLLGLALSVRSHVIPHGEHE